MKYIGLFICTLFTFLLIINFTTVDRSSIDGTVAKGYPIHFWIRDYSNDPLVGNVKWNLLGVIQNLLSFSLTYLLLYKLHKKYSKYIWLFFVTLILWLLIIFFTADGDLASDGSDYYGFPMRMYAEHYNARGPYISEWMYFGVIVNILFFILIFILLNKVQFKAIGKKLKEKLF
jgi:hypothetical protein